MSNISEWGWLDADIVGGGCRAGRTVCHLQVLNVASRLTFPSPKAWNLGFYLKSPDFSMLAMNSECFQHIVEKTHLQVTFGPQFWWGTGSDSDLGVKKRGQESAFLKHLCVQQVWPRLVFSILHPLYSPRLPEWWVWLAPFMEEDIRRVKKFSRGNITRRLVD